MWMGFAAACFVTVVLLYAPGFVSLLGTRYSLTMRLAFAPLVSIVLYSIIAITLSVISLDATGLRVFIFAVAVALGIFLMMRAGATEPRCRVSTCSIKRELLFVSLYLLLGVVITSVIFVKNLDGPNSFLQEYDNVFHLGLIRVFLESGDYSPFCSSLYAAVGDLSVAPRSVSSGFYPAAWHELCAMVVSLTGVGVSASVNAVNSVISGIVYPLSALAFLTYMFRSRTSALVAGALCVLASGSFPWTFLVFGPLYPNLLGYALVPTFGALFMVMCGSRDEGGGLRNLVLFVCGGAALLLAHPNAVFTSALLLAPYLVSRSYAMFSRRGIRGGLIAAELCAIAICAIWLTLYHLPFFESTVSYIWYANRTMTQAIVDAVTLGTSGFTTSQLLLSVFIILGAFLLIRSGERSWIVVSYLLAATVFVVATSTEGDMKQILAGFWYTDPRRLAANLALIGLPLASRGVESAGLLVYRKFLPIPCGENATLRAKCYSLRLVFAAVLLSFLFLPNVELRGQGSVNTAFGLIRNLVRNQNDQEAVNVLSTEELEFANKALELVPDGAVIINQPMDGSAFLFGLTGANLRNRYLDGYDAEEDEALSCIRTNLCDYAESSDVQQAVSEIDARYVLLLDIGGERTESRRYLDNSVVYPVEWDGIDGIDDETPGFKTLLSEGDMRLYEIER